MIVALLHNHYDASHLAAVTAQMQTLGAPTIRVYDTEIDGIYQAIEGCHRLRAADALGIKPKFRILKQSTKLSRLSNLDYDGDAVKVGEIGDWDNHKINFFKDED